MCNSGYICENCKIKNESTTQLNSLGPYVKKVYFHKVFENLNIFDITTLHINYYRICLFIYFFTACVHNSTYLL